MRFPTLAHEQNHVTTTHGVDSVASQNLALYPSEIGNVLSEWAFTNGRLDFICGTLSDGGIPIVPSCGTRCDIVL
jgi:hypothetical protein